ncbi:MAG: C1q-like domain-containing protein [Flavobacterium sp.]
MKKLFFLALGLIALNTTAQSVSINTDGSTAHPSALLEVKSENQGVLIPRMTEAQRNLIASPATGLMIYQTDATAGFYFYNGSAWTSLSGTTGPQGPAGANGLDGVTGPMGPQGPAGPAGTNGTNGAGVPVGGTTGQVLSKIDGTDYNTQWVTPSAGGSGPILLVRASANSAQNINLGSNTAAPDPATCFGSVTTNVGGAFNSATGVFTAPSEGLYLITIQVASSNSIAIFPYLDVDNNFVHGNTATSATDFFGVATQNNASMSSSANNRGVLSAQVYLNTGQVAGIKFQSPSTAAQPTVRTDGATNFTIVKLL